MATSRAQRRAKGINYRQRWINSANAELFAGKLPIFQQDVESKPSPAPIKGWDAISPLSNMEPEYAVTLDNAVPRPNWVEIRGGSGVWVQGLGGPVESLMVYRPAGNTGEKLFAVATGFLFDVSTFSAPSIVRSGLANNRWQYVNISPANNITYLVAVNGIDLGLIYDGTSWANLNITGIATNNLVNVNMHKRRLWFIQKNTTSAWFLATDAIAGAATQYDMGSLLSKGSFLVAMGTWTIDGGNGPDDFAVFISNRGQVIVFKGTDPNNNNAWFHVGTFNIASPIGSRCLTSFGSELLAITLEGLLPISKSLPFDPSGVRSVALTNRIQNAMLMASQTGSTMFGWETILFPAQSLLVMNVPVTENVEQVQFVMNTLTGAWCRFTGWNANCFGLFNDSLFFGTNTGSVHIGYTGLSDIATPIAMSIKTAFNYYDDPGRMKYLSMVRPYIVAGGNVSPGLGSDVDFGDVDFNVPLSQYVISGAVWGSGIWDTSVWFAGSSGNLFNDWQTIGAIGTAIALRLKIDLLPSTISATVPSVFDSGTFDTAVFDGTGVFNQSGQDLPILRLNSFEVVMEQGAPVG